MLIGGLQKLSLLDYPGRVAATLFTIGCDFRCSFCHNPELVDLKRIKKQPQIKQEAFFDFLRSRKGLLDGVCLTGGEPTLQSGLVDFIKRIKKEGFLVKLDTNGNRPEVLQKLFDKNLLDFVAMDIKNTPEKYSQTVGCPVDIRKIFKSVDLIRKRSLNYEFRTTVVPGLIGLAEIKEIGRWLEGSMAFAFQQFGSRKTLDRSWQKISPYPDEKLKQMLQIIQPYFKKVELRGL